MPKPKQIAIETPFYHLGSRSVRRAFLFSCTKTYNFEHRCGWILESLSLSILSMSVVSNCIWPPD